MISFRGLCALSLIPHCLAYLSMCLVGLIILISGFEVLRCFEITLIMSSILCAGYGLFCLWWLLNKGPKNNSKRIPAWIQLGLLCGFAFQSFASLVIVESPIFTATWMNWATVLVFSIGPIMTVIWAIVDRKY